MDHLVAPTIAENAFDFDGAPPDQHPGFAGLIGHQTARNLLARVIFYHDDVAAVEIAFN